MADINIGSLTPVQTINPSDRLLIEQNGAAMCVTGQQLTSFIDRNMVNVSVNIVPSTQTGGGSYNTTTGVLTLNIPEGNGVVGLSPTTTSASQVTYRLTYEDGTYNEFTVTNGSSIASIAKTSTSGLTDTYTITLTNGQTSTFTVTNGAGGVDSVAGVAPGSGGDVAAASLASALLPSLRTKLTNQTYALTWTSDSTYTNYPYKAVLSVSGVSATDYIDMVLSPDDVDSGEFASVADSGASTITIWSNSNTRSTITIPTIGIWR